MKNAMQLKAIIKNIAKEKNISAQLVMQNYMMERLLERVAVSKYQDSFILKGGFLIAAIVGLDSRTTMDMDATMKGIPVTEDTVRKMLLEICAIPIQDDITFSLISISGIREDDEYGGYRVAISANYPPMVVPLKMDITTGDKITPKEIRYEYQLLLEERKIRILTYNLETILAEKIETIVSRGDQNTRPRDFYDVYILSKMQSKHINTDHLKHAIWATSKKRGTELLMNNFSEILESIQKSTIMRDHWRRYQKDFEYANEILFEDTCSTVRKLLGRVMDSE